MLSLYYWLLLSSRMVAAPEAERRHANRTLAELTQKITESRTALRGIVVDYLATGIDPKTGLSEQGYKRTVFAASGAFRYGSFSNFSEYVPESLDINRNTVCFDGRKLTV